MKKLFLSKTSYYLITGIIILLSFFNHSSLFSPILNSDDAVVILMIHDFNLPEDLYFWSSNRFGSLIPMIGQFFYKIFHLSPVQSEAVSHYLLHILGFLGFAGLFKLNITRFLFAIIWFLPPLRMIDVLKVSQGEQYAIIGISVFLINRLYYQPKEHFHFNEYFLMFLITLVFITSVWVSDLAIITISIILFVNTVNYFRKKNKIEYTSILKRPELYFIVFGIMACALFVLYAKSIAPKQESFYDFFDLNTTFKSVKILLSSIGSILLFKAGEPFTSLYSYLLIFMIIIVLLKHQKINFTVNNSKWLTIFLLDLVFVLIIILISKWAYLNNVPRRYFVCSYVSFWLIFLLCVDNIQEMKYKWLLNSSILFTVLIGGLGTFYNFKYIYPKSLRSALEIASEFKNLGKIGIISEYWNSYINSVPDPDNIKATPNDKSEVRKQNMVDSVFSQPQIIVIRDMWMDYFPDTLEQFGYVLVKDDIEFKIANSQACRYKKIKNIKTFKLEELKYNTSHLVLEKELNRNVLFFSPGCPTCIDKHVVYGPYAPVGIGDFKVQFFLKLSQNNSNDEIALLDVSADYGKVQLASKKISKSDFTVFDKFEYIDLEFVNFKRYSHVEFRIFYFGTADLYFDKINLIEK